MSSVKNNTSLSYKSFNILQAITAFMAVGYVPLLVYVLQNTFASVGWWIVLAFLAAIVYGSLLMIAVALLLVAAPVDSTDVQEA